MNVCGYDRLLCSLYSVSYYCIIARSTDISADIRNDARYAMRYVRIVALFNCSIRILYSPIVRRKVTNCHKEKIILSLCWVGEEGWRSPILILHCKLSKF